MVITRKEVKHENYLVNCKCGDYSVAETDWAACLIARKGNCPNNFIKLDDDGACAPGNIGDRHGRTGCVAL
ncbi:hypothetical protein pdam_00011002 [Pocillopora damicornis]|uniref:Uncharacterized protein n=1 Tax=Pocillopora damicornis TaxID=46731 RepID=A0A3M6U4H0_POCDA|nr:hypothetical protein pdam_00011002 [Pocillopora damicornis]